MFAEDSQTLCYKRHFVISMIAINVFYCIGSIVESLSCTRNGWSIGLRYTSVDCLLFFVRLSTVIVGLTTLRFAHSVVFFGHGGCTASHVRI